MKACPFKVAAILAGAKSYETGKPCKRGHIGPRRTSDGQCRECVAEKTKSQSANRADYRKQYYAKNKARHKAWMAEYYIRNRTSLLETTSTWATNNPRSVKAKHAAYSRRHPGRINAKTNARRALRLKATPPWISSSPDMRLAIRKIYEDASRLSKKTGIPHHVDHIHPLKHELICGLHVPWNLQIISASDNCKKGNQLTGLTP